MNYKSRSKRIFSDIWKGVLLAIPLSLIPISIIYILGVREWTTPEQLQNILAVLCILLGSIYIAIGLIIYSKGKTTFLQFLKVSLRDGSIGIAIGIVLLIYQF